MSSYCIIVKEGDAILSLFNYSPPQSYYQLLPQKITMRYILKTDASATLVSFVLTKEVDGRELIVDASSRSLNRAKRNWSVLDKEFFSLVVAVRKNITSSSR